jgi:hypothetical protein
MPRKKPNKEDMRTRLAELTGWQTATRNEAVVAGELHGKRAIDRIYPLNAAAFFDELFFYIKEMGAWPFFEDLDPQSRQGALYPFIQFVMLTMMRCVSGVQSMLAMHDLILTDTALMDLVGFNAAQVQQGSCDRGMDRRKTPIEIRGAISYETIADNIVAIGPEKLANMFNGVIQCLARQGIFGKSVDVVLDATDNEATPGYTTDSGQEVPHVIREKRPDVRASKHARKIEVSVYGWKIWLVFDPISKIPIAMKIDGINAADNTHAYEILLQARKNLEGYTKIRSVSIDRGFLDGKLLWKISKELGIIFYIPAKSNMEITREARSVARQAQVMAAEGRILEGTVYKERIDASGEKTIVVRIANLSCDWLTADGATSAANSKKFKPELVNATVILQWAGDSKDAEKEVVILDTDPSKNPFAGLDAYDERSKIENTINREAKESWFLEHHPKRSEAGMRVHAYFVFMCMGLVTAFRQYRKKADEAEERGEETGITRYRRKLKVTNFDHVIVFVEDHFGIFRNYEVMLLVGVQVRESALLGKTTETVLAKYTNTS